MGLRVYIRQRIVLKQVMRSFVSLEPALKTIREYINCGRSQGNGSSIGFEDLFMYGKSASFAILLILLTIHSSEAQDDIRTYFVGNSLSNDLLTSGGFEELASSVLAGADVLASQHIQCSTPLTGIIASALSDPNEDHSCTGSASKAGANYDLGTFPRSLFNEINVLVLQPFQNATLQDEIDSTKVIINAFRLISENVDSQVYIYQTWDLQRSTNAYLDDWYDRTARLHEEFRPSKSTYDLYFSALRTEGYDFKVIPVGQAFANASEALQGGPLGNVTDTSELFRDFIHGSNAGRYLGALVAAQVITGKSILNVADADRFTAFNDLPNHALSADANASAALRQIAFETAVAVSGSALAGDFDIDGDVDADDIDFYSGNLGLPATNALAQLDLDGDGLVTLADHDFHITTLMQIDNVQTGTRIGDIDLDGSVDVLNDAFILISNLGSTSGGYANGDLNADLAIGVLGDAFRLVAELGLANNSSP